MNVTIRSFGFDEAIEFFGAPFMRRVMASTINDVALKAKLPVVEAVTAEFNVKTSAVKKSIKLSRAKPSELSAVLQSRSKPQPLIDFKGTRKTPRGISARVRKQGKRTILKSRFIARMHSGHRGAYHRRGPKRRMIRGTYAIPKIGRPPILRQPIVEMFGPSVTSLIDEPEIVQAILDYAEEQTPRSFEKKMSQAIQRKAKRYNELTK